MLISEVETWEISAEADSEEKEETSGRARCIKQLALNADRNAKFLSSQ